MGEFNRLISKDVELKGNFSQAIQSAIKLKINNYTQNLDDEVNQAFKKMDQFEKSSFTQEGFCIWDNSRRIWLEPQYLVCKNIKCKNPECFTYKIRERIEKTYCITLEEEEVSDNVKHEVQEFITNTKDKWESIVSSGNSHLLHSKDTNELKELKDHLDQMIDDVMLDFEHDLQE